MGRNKIIAPSKIHAGDSTISGRGVFASANITNGEILEECHYIELEDSNFKALSKPLERYVFDKKRKLCIVLGFGMLYNHSTSPNVCWEIDEEKNLFRFLALRNITVDEELLIDYKNVVNF